MSNPLNIDDLITHLKTKHNINILPVDKQNLKNIGYFHGYKGYRFIKSISNKLNFNNFNEVVILNNFDIELKTLFYPHIMFIETALKNYALEEVLKISNSSDFETICNTCLTHYKSFKQSDKKYKESLHNSIKVKSQFYGVIAREYLKERDLIKHFYHKDTTVPIWAIFEIISMGEFASFVSCLDNNIKENISKSLGLHQAFDQNKLLAERIIICLRDLRNAIAHNDVIYDRRFTKKNIDNNVSLSIKTDMGMTETIDFLFIEDYFILVIYLLKKLKISNIELQTAIKKFEDLMGNFYKNVSKPIFFKIFTSDSRNKINKVKSFINQ